MITSHLNRREWLKLAGGAGLASAVTSSVAVAAGGRPRQAPVGNSLYSQQVIALGPVGYWRLGETNGPTAFDSSGYRNNGLYHGSPAFGQPGAIRTDANTAIGLDGRSYVEIPSQSGFSVGASGLTVQLGCAPTCSTSPPRRVPNTSTGWVKAIPAPASGASASIKRTPTAPTETVPGVLEFASVYPQS